MNLMKKTTQRRKRILWLISGIVFAFLCYAVFFNLFPLRIELETKKTVKTILSEPSDLILAVYTDLHHDPARNEPQPLSDMMSCIRTVMADVPVNALWNLGDLINGQNSTKEEAIRQIKEVVSAENSITVNAHRVPGNHDNNIQSTFGEKGLPETEVLSDSELCAVLENDETDQTEHHSSTRPTDYYVDFPTVRVVCISAENTAFQPETADWLKTEALKTEKEVLVLSHIPTRPEWGYKNDVQNGGLIENALRKFISDGGTLICFIHGHDHGDMISDAGEWKEVAIGCARFQKPKGNGTPGMRYQNRSQNNETKVLFDFVCIDQNKKEVRFIRFGAGEDRIIHY